MAYRPTDFKSVVYTNSTTSALQEHKARQRIGGKRSKQFIFSGRFDNLILNRQKYAHRAEYTGWAD